MESVQTPDEFAKKCEDETIYVLKAKYKGSKEQKLVIERFQNFAKSETDNVYVLAIEKLLDNYDTDWKFNALEEQVVDLRERIAMVEESLEKKTEEPTKRKVPKTMGD